MNNIIIEASYVIYPCGPEPKVLSANPPGPLPGGAKDAPRGSPASSFTLVVLFAVCTRILKRANRGKEKEKRNKEKGTGLGTSPPRPEEEVHMSRPGGHVHRRFSSLLLLHLFFLFGEFHITALTGSQVSASLSVPEDLREDGPACFGSLISRA
ncbi:hypothetical protein BX600DRAFT_127803 [Xylariales sp. PMI_506]|nr:hypothetical protein BX600DRAFT_127803 [Xylariales sp. PMI_506]